MTEEKARLAAIELLNTHEPESLDEELAHEIRARVEAFCVLEILAEFPTRQLCMAPHRRPSGTGLAAGSAKRQGIAHDNVR